MVLIAGVASFLVASFMSRLKPVTAGGGIMRRVK